MSNSFMTLWTIAHQAPLHGISQVRILERVIISFSRGSSQPRDLTVSPALAGGFFTGEPPGKPLLELEKSYHFILLMGKLGQEKLLFQGLTQISFLTFNSMPFYRKHPYDHYLYLSILLAKLSC